MLVKKLFRVISLLLLLCSGLLLSIESSAHEGKPKSEEANMEVFTYLVVTQRNCVTGNTHIFSPIVKVSKASWAKEKYAILQKFEHSLSKYYPKSVFQVNLEVFQGEFTSLEEARLHKTNSIAKKNAVSRSVEALPME
ncbi:hypothetical protein V6R21_28375 [Limibacter armeniacum]|uniref:hypothetical protein n=1 Tax=Limibacter armeniacum TaxID=466084 RepID=UPI002FE58EAB